MKKFISALLAIILCLTPVTAFATEATDPTKIKMGDINLDGKISAADARAALRCAAKLDPSDNISMLSIDADGDGRISASDARCILRYSAKLSKFANGFDGKGNPCVLEVINSNVYHISFEQFNGNSKEPEKIEIIKKNNNFYLQLEDKSLGNVALMMVNNDMYAIMEYNGKKIGMYLPPELLDKFLSEPDMEITNLNEIVNLINLLIPQNIGLPAQVEKDGQKMFCYTYSTTLNHTCKLYISATGKPLYIDAVTETESQRLLNFNSISADAPDRYFDLNSLDEIM